MKKKIPNTESYYKEYLQRKTKIREILHSLPSPEVMKTYYFLKEIWNNKTNSIIEREK